jgi:hypothetical protein
MVPEKLSLVDYGFKITDGNLRRSRRKMYRRLNFGAVPGYAPICYDTNDPLTVKKGCEQRVLRVSPTPSIATLARFRLYCRKKFQKWFGANLGQAQQMTFEEWLESLLNVNEMRKFEFEQARAMNRGGPPPLSIASRVVCFIKTECYSAFKFPRWIMSRKDQFKVLFGPIVKAIEKVVYQRPEFVKHMSMEQRAARVQQLQKAGRRFIIADFNSFEASFIDAVMKACEFELMRSVVPWWVNEAYCEKVLSGINVLVLRALFIIILLWARRMSGEMCTSCFNGIANLMVTKFIVHEKGGHLDILVEGDDSIFSTTVEVTPEDYAKLGFSVKLVEIESPTNPVPVDKSIEPGSIAFCGIMFSSDGQAMKEPRKFLQTFGWTHSFIHAGAAIMDQLLRAKALSACFEAPNCPIIGVMARVALQKTSNVKIEDRIFELEYADHYTPGYTFEQLKSGKFPEFCPTMATRLSFQNVFGVSIDQQIAIEDCIRSGKLHMIPSILPPTSESLYFSDRYVVAA